MKAFTKLILFPLILNYTVCFAQNTKMNKEVEEIIQLGKDSIVKLALQLLDERVDKENFSKIKVLTNGKEVFVSFTTPIKYLPKKSVFYSDVGVMLLEKSSFYSQAANPIDYRIKKDIPYYQQTEEIGIIIQFVIEAINKNSELGSINKATFDDNMIIRENKKHYDISIISEFQESWYKIEKITGKIYDARHAHLEPEPFDDDKDIFNEVNW